MASEEHLKLTFGVEVECVAAYPAGLFGTGPKDIKIRREVEEYLDRSGIPVNELRGDDPYTFEKWTVNEDQSITMPPNTATIEHDSLELSSRVFYHDDQSSFQEIREVLSMVHTNFNIFARPENTCGLHVHIGNEDRGFPFEVLKRCMLLVTAFEHLLKTVAPAYRFDTSGGRKCFCYLPSTLITFQGCSLQERLNKIKACEREWQLHDILNPIWYGKNLAFHLASHSDGTKRTIEHRMFRGTTDADEIIANVELCASLISFAWHVPDGELDHLLKSGSDASFTLQDFFAAIGKPHLWFLLCDGLYEHHSTDLPTTLPEESSPKIQDDSASAEASTRPGSWATQASGTELWDVVSSGQWEEEQDEEQDQEKEKEKKETDPLEGLTEFWNSTGIDMNDHETSGEDGQEEEVDAEFGEMDRIPDASEGDWGYEAEHDEENTLFADDDLEGFIAALALGVRDKLGL